MDLIDHLQVLSTRAEQVGDSLTNEEATKMALIAPFIQSLGYDIFNPTEVKPEFSADLPGIKQGERVDYAVLENGQPKILIEAKPYRTDLRSAERVSCPATSRQRRPGSESLPTAGSFSFSLISTIRT